MKNKGGRKSYFEELNIANRYALLSEPYFAFLKKMLASKDKSDKKWAAERLEKAYVKMIPQTLQGDPENPLYVKEVEIHVRKDNKVDGA